MPTIKDVAGLSGFSVSAVSKYLKAPDSVREETGRRISEAIALLGYSPNPTARSLRTGKTGIVAVLIPEITNPVFAELFSNVYEGCLHVGMTPVLHAVTDAAQLKRILPAVSPYHADGLILCFLNGQDICEPIIRYAAGAPLIQIGFEIDTRISGSIMVDVAHGMKLLARHLLEGGCQDIAYLGEPGADIASGKKISGFLEGLSGKHNVRVMQGYRGLEGGFEGAGCLLEKGMPDAIVCETDILAIGCMKRLAQKRIAIPDRISVTGYDDIQIAGMYEPSLTTVRLPSRQISELAVGMLEGALRGRKQGSVPVTPELVVRGSTK